MRPIKFRGKRIDTGEWVYGNYIEKIDPTKKESTFWAALIHDRALTAVEVCRSTVDQFTGRMDNKKMEIYENDLCIINTISDTIRLVIFDKGSFCFSFKAKSGYYVIYPIRGFNDDEIEIVGNVDDNPELLKGGEECQQ